MYQKLNKKAKKDITSSFLNYYQNKHSHDIDSEIYISNLKNV